MYKKVVVCFSYSAPPLNDPEAFCTARLLSALANNGYFVHLVTINHPKQIEQSTVEELLNYKIKVSIIKINKKSNIKNNYIYRFKYLHFYETSQEIPVIVNEVKKVLQNYKNPILLTRALPNISNIVGYHVKEFANSWIAHFSDPVPILGAYSGRTYYKKIFDLFWTKRIFKSADQVTVTCFNAKNYFVNRLGNKFKKKISVLYHVGYPPLKYTKTDLKWGKSQFNLVHVGHFTNSRYVNEIFSELEKVSKVWPEFRLTQFGRIDTGGLKLAEEERSWLNVESKNFTSPNISSYILSQASMNLIIDTKENLTISPYLPSKFAYALAANKPVLAVGKKYSEMYNLSLEFSSIYFVDISEPNALFSYLLKIKELQRNLKLPEKELLQLFHPNKIANDFTNIIKHHNKNEIS